ncbi:opsin-5-like [Haliotis cracherodii]|uniref:opsin-5-like n=1 Tax=Haliotis cracherodii TaxID=6455 RepID=UPI0039EC5C79
MFLREKKFRTSVDTLLFNLSISDLGMTAVCFPFVISSSFAQEWIHGDVGCTMYGFLSFLFGNGSISTLSAISVERYLVICRKYQGYREDILRGHVLPFVEMQGRNVTLQEDNARPRVARVVTLFPRQHKLAVICHDLSPIKRAWDEMERGLRQDQNQPTSCSVDWQGRSLSARIFIFGLVVLVLGVNTCIMIFCYVCIYYTARKERFRRRAIQDIVITKTCFLLVVSFFVCWTPYAVKSIWESYGNPRSLPPFFAVGPVIFAKLSSCLNPMLYVLMSKRFRKRYLDTIKCKKRNRMYPSSITTIQMTFRQYSGR